MSPDTVAYRTVQNAALTPNSLPNLRATHRTQESATNRAGGASNEATALFDWLGGEGSRVLARMLGSIPGFGEIVDDLLFQRGGWLRTSEVMQRESASSDTRANRDFFPGAQSSFTNRGSSARRVRISRRRGEIRAEHMIFSMNW